MEKQTFIGKIYKRTFEKIVPSHAVLSLLFCLIFNSVIYMGTNLFLADAHHYDIASPLDKMIPFQPQWIYIYVFCYVEWSVGYIMITRQDKEHWYRFAFADIISRVICLFFFVFFPTTMARPEIVGNSISEQAVKFLYGIDPSSNLFPSIHCLVSWFCYIGVRKVKTVPKWYKMTMLVYAILVFVSVVTLKQHVLIDIVAGVSIAEICYFISNKTNGYKKLMSIFDKINVFVFGKNDNE